MAETSQRAPQEESDDDGVDWMGAMSALKGLSDEEDEKERDQVPFNLLNLALRVIQEPFGC